jgi:putative ABC transport system permease protein
MRPTSPPRLAEWILARFVGADDGNAVLGDLEEIYRGLDRGRFRADLWYWAQTLTFAVSFTAHRARVGVDRGDTAPRAGRNQNTGGRVETWIGEVKLGVRSLSRRPGFALLAVLTLALGIGVNTAIFSVVHGSLLRALPYPESERLLFLSDSWKEVGGWGSGQVYLNIQELRERSRMVADMAAFRSRSMNFLAGEEPERVPAVTVDPTFFTVLGLPPVVGRDFVPDDNRPGNEKVAILGHDLWERGFGGDPDVVGNTIRLDSEAYTVLGVASPDVGILGNPQIFIPFGWAGRQDLSRGRRDVNSIGRLAPGATVEAARQELEALFTAIAEEYPGFNEGWTVDARTFSEWITAGSRRSLLLLAGAALLVLLIALVNVTNLVLVRTETRQREIAIRLSLGARRGRLLPFFLTEGMLLALMGGALGALAAFWGVKALVALYGSSLPRSQGIGLDGAALGVGLGLSLVSGVLVGLIPALRVDPRHLQEELREGGHSVSRSSTRLRHGLITTECALAVVVVVSAGLLVNSFWHLRRVDLGVAHPERVVTFRLSLPPVRYPDDASRLRFFEDLSTAVDRLGPVESIGLTSELPLWGGRNVTELTTRGATEPVAHFVEYRFVTNGFFEAVGVPLLAGRLFGPSDYADSHSGALVTQELARQLFPDDDAVGRLLDVDGGTEVLGTVGDIRDRGLTSDYPPGFYMPMGPGRTPSAPVVTVRVSADPMGVVPAIRQVVRALDGEVPVYSVQLLSEVAARRRGVWRLSTSLLAAFAALALLLGAVGVYGVMSHSVTQRTRELGVRMAMGARRPDVVFLVLREGLGTATVGVILGVGGALASGRVLQSQLFGVEATDPLTFVSAAAVLWVISLAACYLPARRASTADPLQALRHE